MNDCVTPNPPILLPTLTTATLWTANLDFYTLTKRNAGKSCHQPKRLFIQAHREDEGGRHFQGLPELASSSAPPSNNKQ